MAILAVLAYHLDPRWLPGGFLGVDIFFVISGFLITSLLVRERARTGRVDLPGFWLRRARRLLPALIACVLASTLLARLVETDLLVGVGRQLLGALTFTTNWVEISAGTDYFSSTSPQLFLTFWSLAVEEQFYLFWPLACLGLLVVFPRAAARAALLAGVAGLSAALMALRLDPEAPTRVYYGTDTHLSGLMIGAALAMLLLGPSRAGTRSALWEKHRRAVIGGSLITLAVGLLTLEESSPLTFRGGILLISLLTGVLILAAVDRPGRLRQALELPPLRWIGERSYGLYLWHWPVVLLVSAEYAVEPGSPAYLWTRGFALVTTVAVADLSYRFLETPVRRHGFRGVASALRAWAWHGAPWRGRLVAGTALAAVLALVAVVLTAPERTSTEDLITANAAAATLPGPVATSTPRTTPTPTASSGPVARPGFTMPTGQEIDAVGDSLMVGAVHALRAYFPGIRIDAESNRRWRQGLAVASTRAATMRRAVILGLGTNGGVDAAAVEKTITALGPDRMVVILTLHGRFSRIATDNAALRAIAARHPNVAIADWHAALVGTSGNLQSDGIHSSIRGAHLYSKVIRQAFADLSLRLTGKPVTLKPVPGP